MTVIRLTCFDSWRGLHYFLVNGVSKLYLVQATQGIIEYCLLVIYLMHRTTSKNLLVQQEKRR
jgi:hypothetical protein